MNLKIQRAATEEAERISRESRERFKELQCRYRTVLEELDQTRRLLAEKDAEFTDL